MTEFQHPPINCDIPFESSMERAFAEHAYEVLLTYGVKDEEQIGNYYVTYPLTERADFLAQDGRDVALRLVQVPAFSTGDGKDLDIYPSFESYHVMQFQYGFVRGNPELPTDEDYDWHDYIAIITKLADSPEVDLMDMSTGKPLSGEDIYQAEILLGMMQRELRAMVFEEISELSADVPTIDREIGRFVTKRCGEEVSHVEFHVDYESVTADCGYCGSNLCEHRSDLLN